LATGTRGESKKEKIKSKKAKFRRFPELSSFLPFYFFLVAEGIMGVLEEKRAVIFGVANDRSIAWAIAEAFHAEGAELGFTYAGEVLEKRVRPLAEGIGAKIILPCDVTKDEEIEKVFATLKQEWGAVDILIHAIAFANKEDLSNPYVQTSRQGFHLAMDVSAYSLVALARYAAPLMEGRKASMVTLTYMGSEKVIPNYNVMGVAKAALEASVRYLAHDLGAKGIRVNAISAGPIRTLAAAGISGFKDMLHHVSERAPLKRNIEAEEVGKTALYLCSDWGSAVTGEVIHVDAGYNIMGM
jgi:enoyl-[acyl-carrier protein] reductase I